MDDAKRLRDYVPNRIEGLLSDEVTALREAVNQFRIFAIGEGYHLPEHATDNCDAAADEFVSFLENAGIVGFIEHYSFCDKQHPSAEVALDRARFPFFVSPLTRWHWATRVGENLIIDWTSRQFLARAPFPSIWVDDESMQLATVAA